MGLDLDLDQYNPLLSKLYICIVEFIVLLFLCGITKSFLQSYMCADIVIAVSATTNILKVLNVGFVQKIMLIFCLCFMNGIQLFLTCV